MKYTHCLNGFPRWDRYRSHIMKISLCLSLAFCFLVMNVEGIHSEVITPDYGPEEESIFSIPPNTYRKPKEKVPIVPKAKIKKPDLIKEIITTDIVELVKNEKALKDMEDNRPEVPFVAPDVPSNPEAAPIMEAPEDKTFNFVDRMPLFGDCMNNDLSREEWTDCSNKAILRYIASKLTYPSIAKENNLEGTVVLRFVISETGSISNITIYRDIGMGCGEAAKRVLKKMPDWIPGKHHGRPVKVMYTIPIKFKLD